jgi:hypothetical protein
LIDVEENLKLFFTHSLTIKKVVADEIHAFKDSVQLFLELFFGLSLMHSRILFFPARNEQITAGG